MESLEEIMARLPPEHQQEVRDNASIPAGKDGRAEEKEAPSGLGGRAQRI